MNARNAWKICAGLALGMTLSPAQAVTGCSNYWLSGVYGLQFSGSAGADLSGGIGGAVTPPAVATSLALESPGTTYSAAGLARIVMDGSGNLSGDSAVILNGTWSEGLVTGTYNVNDDCSGSLVLTDSGGGVQHFDAVVLNQGDSIVLMQTDRGTGMSFVVKRARNSCQTSDLVGTFGIRTSGTIMGAGAFSSIGTVTLDGQGDATSAESRFSGGAYSQVTTTGTIGVNVDCTLTLTLTPSSGSASQVNFRGLVLTNQKEILLLQSDSGTAVTGSQIAQ